MSAIKNVATGLTVAIRFPPGDSAAGDEPAPDPSSVFPVVLSNTTSRLWTSSLPDSAHPDQFVVSTNVSGGTYYLFVKNDGTVSATQGSSNATIFVKTSVDPNYQYTVKGTSNLLTVPTNASSNTQLRVGPSDGSDFQLWTS